MKNKQVSRKSAGTAALQKHFVIASKRLGYIARLSECITFMAINITSNCMPHIPPKWHDAKKHSVFCLVFTIYLKIVGSSRTERNINTLSKNTEKKMTSSSWCRSSSTKNQKGNLPSSPIIRPPFLLLMPLPALPHVLLGHKVIALLLCCCLRCCCPSS